MASSTPIVAGSVSRKGYWEPLPLIIYGYAVHPLPPNRRDTRFSRAPRLSTVTEASTGEPRDEIVDLNLGDEVYAFERYAPSDKDLDGVWFRGSVVSSSLRFPSLLSPLQLCRPHRYRSQARGSLALLLRGFSRTPTRCCTRTTQNGRY